MKKIHFIILICLLLGGCAKDYARAPSAEILKDVTKGGSDFDSMTYVALPHLTSALDRGFLKGMDNLDYYLATSKDKSTGKVFPKLVLNIKYFDTDWRFYNSASFKGGEQPAFKLVSRKVNDCSTYKTLEPRCNYQEIMVIVLDDNFIRNNKNGFSVRFNSQNGQNNMVVIEENYMSAFIETIK